MSAEPERGVASVPGRVVAIDLGEKRIGIARSDAARRVALPYQVLERSGDVATDHRRLAAMAEELGASTLVVGLPLGLDGRRGPAALKVLAEVEQLRSAVAIGVETWDERLSTAEVLAHRRVSLVTRDRVRRSGRGGRGVGRGAGRGRPVVDDLAAAVVLQAWLDAHAAAAGTT